MRSVRLISYGLVFAVSLSDCSGGGSPVTLTRGQFPAGISRVALTTADNVSGGPCSVSVDGFVWYALPKGALPPIDFTAVNCKSVASIDSGAVSPLPHWSRPAGPTQAIFVATSLQEAYSLAGMQGIERDAEGASLPVTWLVGNATYLTQNAAYYNTIHAGNGDDVELEDDASLYTLASQLLPWYSPSVSVEGAGHERNIASALALGNGAFWGITWNSHGTDHTSDEGAPWGSYCADIASYKRPSPAGDCTLLAFEWAARDLTRAYLANTNADGYSAEAAYSSIPEDILQRGGFDTITGAEYARELVDAYAAAGSSQPLVMMSEFESADEGAHGSRDDDVLTALYGEATSVGMRTMTLRSAATAARLFSAQPRAIAFPFISGGHPTSYNGVGFAPATIDFHDNVAGMTFISGHTLPSRLFEYAQDPASAFNRTLVEMLPSNESYPQLVNVTSSGGMLSFTFQATQALHFGVALWTDPATLMLTGPNVVPAGHAGAVITFDLPAGRSTQTVPCGACPSATFPYST